jgi:hypothetical protein
MQMETQMQMQLQLQQPSLLESTAQVALLTDASDAVPRPVAARYRWVLLQALPAIFFKSDSIDIRINAIDLKLGLYQSHVNQPVQWTPELHSRTKLSLELWSVLGNVHVEERSMMVSPPKGWLKVQQDTLRLREDEQSHNAYVHVRFRLEMLSKNHNGKMLYVKLVARLGESGTTDEVFTYTTSPVEIRSKAPRNPPKRRWQEPPLYQQPAAWATLVPPGMAPPTAAAIVQPSSSALVPLQCPQRQIKVEPVPYTPSAYAAHAAAVGALGPLGARTTSSARRNSSGGGSACRRRATLASDAGDSDYETQTHSRKRTTASSAQRSKSRSRSLDLTVVTNTLTAVVERLDSIYALLTRDARDSRDSRHGRSSSSGRGGIVMDDDGPPPALLPLPLSPTGSREQDGLDVAWPSLVQWSTDNSATVKLEPLDEPALVLCGS